MGSNRRTGRRKKVRTGLAMLAALLGAGGAAAGAGPATPAAAAAPRVLLVGTFHGRRGQFTSIQAAVNAARPGDDILVAPGDYHEEDALAHPPTPTQASLGDFGGVLIHTSGITIRGMDRSTVIVDGTKPGAPRPCDSQPQWQELGPPDPKGGNYGNNGIVAFRANDVWIENLTVCNYLNGNGSAGNEIWWDGGSGTAHIGLKGYWGSYLTATTSYYGNPTVGPAYGIFANDATGPATWTNIYASNFDDSGMYVGACRQVCDVTISRAWMEYNALGYSGTNSGGALVVEHSRFDNNQDGFDTNTQILGDPPPPQNGDCPGTRTSPITHTRSCWVFLHNLVEDNNDAHAPIAPGGYASAGPVGTGMTVAGGRNDTVMDNTFRGNAAWGALFVPFPDSDKPYPGITCAGSGGHEVAGFGCVYDPEGDRLVGNTFADNGYWKNPSNGDYGQVTLFGHEPQNCFSSNTAPDGSAPADLEKVQPRCGPITTAANTGGPLLGQVECDTGFGSCPATASGAAGYPKPAPADVVIHPLPAHLPTMPNPCQGVPANAWCKGGKPI